MKKNTTKILVLSALCAALAALFVYLASVLPGGKLACFFIAALFTYVPAAEDALLPALLSYAVSSLLCFLLLPNKLTLIPYAFLIGNYGVVIRLLDRSIPAKAPRYLLALLYCDLMTALGLLFAAFVLGLDPAETAGLPLWLLLVLLQAALVAFVALYAYAQYIYDSRIRRLLHVK